MKIKNTAISLGDTSTGFLMKNKKSNKRKTSNSLLYWFPDINGIRLPDNIIN
jgi:hypothetical protein